MCPVESAETPNDLNELIGTWLDWSQASDELHLSVSKVRQLIREHQLAGAVPVPGAGQQIPAELIMDGEIVKGVPGVCTVLHDTAAGPADRRAAGEPRLRGQASRPVDGLLNRDRSRGFRPLSPTLRPD